MPLTELDKGLAEPEKRDAPARRSRRRRPMVTTATNGGWWRGADAEELVPFLFIGVLGLVAAGLCFGLLESSAEADWPLNVGGAIAGAIAAWLTLSRVYLGVRQGNRSIERLEHLNRQLQAQMLRGAPSPEGFVREVDDLRRIVLARPAGWDVDAGVIAHYVEKTPAQRVADGIEDPFPARLIVSYEPRYKGDVNEEYQAMCESLEHWAQDVGAVLTTETYMVAGGPDTGAVRSRRFTIRCWAEASIQHDPALDRDIYRFAYVSQQDVRRQVEEAAERLKEAGANPARLEDILQEVYLALDRWDVDPREGVSGMLARKCEERGVMENVEGDDSNAGTSTPLPEDSAEQFGAPSVSGEDELASRRESLVDVIPPLLVDVVPVNRALVACCPPNINQTYLFEFIDDVYGFPTSSEMFNHTLASVRFLT